MDREFSFEVAANFDRSYTQLKNGIKPCIAKPVETFRRNKDRITSLICLPAWLIHIATQWNAADQNVRLAFFQGIHPMEALGKKLEGAEAVRVHNAIVQVIQSTQNAETPEQEGQNWRAAFQKFEDYVVYSRPINGPPSPTGIQGPMRCFIHSLLKHGQRMSIWRRISGFRL